VGECGLLPEHHDHRVKRRCKCFTFLTYFSPTGFVLVSIKNKNNENNNNIIKKINNNNNTMDSVYRAVTMTESLEEFTWLT